MIEDGLYGSSKTIIPFTPPKVEEPIVYKPTKFYECVRCKQQRPALGACPTCPSFDQRICTCSHISKVHSFAKGNRSKIEIDVCGSCLSVPGDNLHQMGKVCMLFVEARPEDLVCKLEIANDL